MAYVRSKLYDAAASSFEKALKQNPSDPAARFALGWAEQLRGHDDAAIREYEAARRQSLETLGFTLNNLSAVYEQKKETKKAIEALERLASLQTDAPFLHLKLGRLYLAAGQRAKAMESLNLQAAKTPGNAEVQQALKQARSR